MLAVTDPREAYRRSEIDARVEGGSDPEVTRAQDPDQRDGRPRAPVERDRAHLRHRHGCEQRHGRDRTVGDDADAGDDAVVGLRVFDGRDQSEVDRPLVKKAGAVVFVQSGTNCSYHIAAQRSGNLLSVI